MCGRRQPQATYETYSTLATYGYRQRPVCGEPYWQISTIPLLMFDVRSNARYVGRRIPRVHCRTINQMRRYTFAPTYLEG